MPEAGLRGSIGVHEVRLGAAEPRGSVDVVMKCERPVATGLWAPRCTPKAWGAVVSERGLEPPRDYLPLGPQPGALLSVACQGCISAPVLTLRELAVQA